jgi:glutathione synthase
MKLAFFVNEVATEIDEYTTTRLAIAAARMGHDVWYVGAGDVVYEPDGNLRARGYRARHRKGDDLTSFLERIKEQESVEDIALGEADAVMLRNDSIEDLHERPWAATSGVIFGRMLAECGVTVVNDPEGLMRAASKLYLEEFPESVRPRCRVTRDPDAIKAFVEETGPTILKPLYGAKGRNVFMVEEQDDPNLSQMIDAVLEDGYVIAQERVEGAENGDVRLFLLEGEPLRIDSSTAAFRRVPPDDDVRANISTGGKPESVEIGEREMKIVHAMRDRLRRDGMFFVGIDIIGDKVVEINAESPGGMQAVEHFSKLDFGVPVIEALEKRASKGSLRRAG